MGFHAGEKDEPKIKNIDLLQAEVARLRSICKIIASGLRGQYASREDMAKLAESAEISVGSVATETSVTFCAMTQTD